MPKDADFNCGVNDGRTPVEQYAKVTRGAHGVVDFWGNVWEWTSTERSRNGETVTLGVKGGAWNTARTDCRTEYRDEGRDASLGYEDVGFRVIQVLGGKEAELLRISEKKGHSTFKAVIIPDEAGSCEIVITVYDRDGNASAPTSNSVTIMPKKSGK